MATALTLFQSVLRKLTTGEVDQNFINLRTTADAALPRAEAETAVSTKGVAFPAVQVPSDSPNTLDDYEEGTWTPVASNLTVVGSPNHAGTYVKIGRMVFVTLTVSATTSTASTTNSTSFTLPFPSAVSGVAMAVNASTNVGYGEGYVSGSYVYTPTWNTTAVVVVSFMYMAAS